MKNNHPTLGQNVCSWKFDTATSTVGPAAEHAPCGRADFKKKKRGVCFLVASTNQMETQRQWQLCR